MRLKEQLVQNEKTTNAERIVSLQQYQKKLLAALKEAEEAYKRHIAKLDSLKKEQEGLALRKERDLLDLDSGTISKEDELRRNTKIYNEERTKAEVEYAKAVLKRQDSSMDKAKELYEAQITDAKRLAAQAKERGDLYSFRKYRRDIEEYYSVLEKINNSQQKDEGTALDQAKQDIADLTAEADRLTGELIGQIGLALLDLGAELLIDVDATYLQNSILLAITAQQYVIQVQAQVSGLPGSMSVTNEATGATQTSVPDVRLNRVEGLAGYYAGGGMVQGSGTDTSDNILSWLSPNEFVLRAKAVRNIIKEYGIHTLNYINEFGRLPKYAFGGMVTNLNSYPSVTHTTKEKPVSFPNIKNIFSIPKFFRGGLVSTPQQRITKPDVVKYIHSVIDIPRFSSGGYVNSIKEVSKIVQEPSSYTGSSSANDKPPAYLTPLHLHFPGGEVITAKVNKLEEDAIKKYLAKENLKRGRR
jgi:hypothetical protein